MRPDFLAEPAQYLAITHEISACGDCQDSKRKLCRVHRRILPRGFHSALARLIGEQSKPGALPPQTAKATLTRAARARQRAYQMFRRGVFSLKKA